jgi:Cu-processing system ATP-binding protein
MIELAGVSKAYGKVEALKGVDLRVGRGEFVGIVGPNGAGKSTLIRIMVGVERPTEGKVFRDPGVRVGFMPERVSFYDNLTGLETLTFFARIKGYGEREVKEVLSLGLLPEEDLRRKVGEYSKGMKQRVNLLQALLGPPEVLIMDEPTSGLDPEGVRLFFNVLEDLRRERNLTVILSTHILAEIEERVERVVILKEGRKVADERPEELYMKLPVRFLIKPKGDLNSLEDLLRRAGAKEIKKRGNTFVAEVPPEKKAGFMRDLMERGDLIEDLVVRGPSLEEVFFDGERRG